MDGSTIEALSFSRSRIQTCLATKSRERHSLDTFFTDIRGSLCRLVRAVQGNRASLRATLGLALETTESDVYESQHGSAACCGAAIQHKNVGYHSFHQKSPSKSSHLSIPTFMVFKNGQVVETVKSANPSALQAVVRKLAAEVDATDDGSSATSGGFAESSSSGSSWMGRDLARGYKDVTDQVEVKGLDLLNADPKAGSVRTLFAADKPSALSSGSGSGKGKGKEEDSKGQDWVESDTDEQLMLYVPFQSTLKVHSLQITSIPPAPGSSDGDEDEIPLRPKTIHLYQNRAGVLGFDEAEGIPATQTIVLRPEDWHSETCTATVELRFVKFQNVTSLVLFVEDGEGEGEKVRLDRVRIVGESGEKRTMGKLEKIGDGP